MAKQTVVAKTVAEPKAQQIGEVITTGLTVGSVFGAVKSIATKGIAKAVTAVIPSTTKGKVKAAIAVPAGISAVASNPKILSEAASIPSKSAAFGADVGRFTADPSLESALNIVQENPLISGLVAGGAVLGGAGAIISGVGALENVRTRESVVDLTSALQNSPSSNLPSDSGAAAKPVQTSTEPFAPSTAVTPATAKLSATSTKKSKSSRKSTPSVINQKVNVIVQNKNTSAGIRSQTKNYIKEPLLAR